MIAYQAAAFKDNTLYRQFQGFFADLLVSQSFDWIEPSGFSGGIYAEEDSHSCSEEER